MNSEGSVDLHREREGDKRSYRKFLGDLLETGASGERFALSNALEESGQRDPFQVRSTLVQIARREIVEENERGVAVVVPNGRMVKTTEIAHLFQRLSNGGER